MKTTIDIPEKLLKEAMKNAGTTQKNKAVLAAIEEFNRRCRIKSLIGRMGKSTTFMTHGELMTMRELDMPKPIGAGRVKRAG